MASSARVSDADASFCKQAVVEAECLQLDLNWALNVEGHELLEEWREAEGEAMIEAAAERMGKERADFKVLLSARREW